MLTNMDKILPRKRDPITNSKYSIFNYSLRKYGQDIGKVLLQVVDFIANSKYRQNTEYGKVRLYEVYTKMSII